MHRPAPSHRENSAPEADLVVRVGTPQLFVQKPRQVPCLHRREPKVAPKLVRQGVLIEAHLDIPCPEINRKPSRASRSAGPSADGRP
eukprot:14457214-Heterocapsa_arctica.AAC.1